MNRLINTKNIILCMLLISVQACKEHQTREVAKQPSCLSKEEMLSYGPLSIANTTVVKTLRLNGVVVYNPNAVVSYVSLVGGIITNTYFTLGDKVEKNQVLAEIKSAELNAIEAEVKQIKANLEVAELHFQATQGFYKDGIASEKELISARSEKENMEFELRKLQTNMELYSASPEKGVFQIKAPRSGYVVGNSISAGMQIGAEGDPLFTISDLDEIWVNVNVYATDIGSVKKGMPVSIKTNSHPDKVFEGKIDQISNVLEPEDNVLKARVVLENKDLFLKPGLHVEALVKNKSNQKALLVPANSLVFNNDAYYTVQFKDRCSPIVKQVNILSQDEDTFYIESGLVEGDIIATENTLLLFESTVAAN